VPTVDECTTFNWFRLVDNCKISDLRWENLKVIWCYW